MGKCCLVTGWEYWDKGHWWLLLRETKILVSPLMIVLFLLNHQKDHLVPVNQQLLHFPPIPKRNNKNLSLNNQQNLR